MPLVGAATSHRFQPHAPATGKLQRRVWAGGYAEAFGKGELRFVVEVLLSAEEQHLVGPERFIDGGSGLGVESPQSHAVDTRTDVLPQLHNAEITSHGLSLPAPRQAVGR